MPSDKPKDKHQKYEKEAERKQILNIGTSASDDPVEWECIKAWLLNKGDGNAKEGLKKIAEENGVV